MSSVAAAPGSAHRRSTRLHPADFGQFVSPPSPAPARRASSVSARRGHPNANNEDNAGPTSSRGNASSRGRADPRQQRLQFDEQRGAAVSAALTKATTALKAAAAICSLALVSAAVAAISFLLPLPGKAVKGALSPRMRPLWIILAALALVSGPRATRDGLAFAYRLPAAVYSSAVNAGKEWAGLLIAGDSGLYTNGHGAALSSSSCGSGEAGGFFSLGSSGSGSRCGTVAPASASSFSSEQTHQFQQQADEAVRQLKAAVDESARVLAQIKANAAASAASANAAAAAATGGNGGGSGNAADVGNAVQAALESTSTLVAASKKELEEHLTTLLDSRLKQADEASKAAIETLAKALQEEQQSQLTQALEKAQKASAQHHEAALISSLAAAVAGGGMMRGDQALWGEIAAAYAKLRAPAATDGDSNAGDNVQRAELIASVAASIAKLADGVASSAAASPKSLLPAIAASSSSTSLLSRSLVRVVDHSGASSDGLFSSSPSAAGNGVHGGLATVGDVASMIDSALAAYAADVIASPDYALASAGACVAKEATSESWGKTTVDAKVALTPSLQPGHCWPMAGSAGNLTVKLSRPIAVTSVAIDHLSAAVALRRPSAEAPGASSLPPNAAAVKSFNVWGYHEGSPHRGRTLLGQYTYDASGPQTQVFVIPPPETRVSIEGSEVHSHVQLEVLSNHGQPDFTCIYRFRVLGAPEK